MHRIALIAACLVANIVSSSSLAGARMEVAKKLWEERLASAGGKPIVQEHYPTEKALVFLSAFSHTRDPRYAEQARIQLEYSHAREIDGVFVTSEKSTTRDYQARHIYNFYLAYRVLADGRYLRWADDCAAAMIRVIPRASHSIAGETHTTFEAGFFDASGKRVGSNAQYIDVNQNAEVALAYSLLYHDPASKFFRDPLAKEIAYEELLASMSIQDMSTGEIPLTEDIPGADTLYGSYACFSWVWCQLLWRDEKFEPHIQAAGKWLGAKMNLATDTQRFYPTRHDGGFVSYWEANYRLPLLWYCRIDAKKFVSDLFVRMPNPEATPTDQENAPGAWAYFDLMGVGREFYLGE